mmetsp:Transcript_8062/g.12072  ORF Transcript_8062/g.12072 Transcript_8062/m.12072 type:complete len:305 (+) Transcript_8062:44-958(+)
MGAAASLTVDSLPETFDLAAAKVKAAELGLPEFLWPQGKWDQLSGPNGFISRDQMVALVEEMKTGEVFKPVFSAWWKKAGPALHETIMKLDFEDKKAWADHIVDFITKGLGAVEWVSPVSDRILGDLGVTTEQEYIDEYAKKIAGRDDVASTNLAKIANRARVCVEGASEDPNLEGKPEYQALAAELKKFSQALTWSQGGFGPQAYSAEFLTTYANTMISESLWKQHPSKCNPPFENFDTIGGSTADDSPLECGIFYIDPLVEYPLHHHKQLECYFILAGETRFVYLLDNDLVDLVAARRLRLN